MRPYGGNGGENGAADRLVGSSIPRQRYRVDVHSHTKGSNAAHLPEQAPAVQEPEARVPSLLNFPWNSIEVTPPTSKVNFLFSMGSPSSRFNVPKNVTLPAMIAEEQD